MTDETPAFGSERDRAIHLLMGYAPCYDARPYCADDGACFRLLEEMAKEGYVITLATTYMGRADVEIVPPDMDEDDIRLQSDTLREAVTEVVWRTLSAKKEAEE